jgi:hypothetical protein
MSETKNKLLKKDLYIIKFVLLKEQGQVNLYNFMTYDDEGFAVKYKKKLLFFSNISKAKRIADKVRLGIKYHIPKRAYLTCDIVSVVDSLNRMYDKNTDILNFINITDDMLKTMGIEYPARYRKSLYEFADYLTFTKKVQPFFKISGYSKEFMKTGLIKINKIILDNSILIE